MIIKKLYYVIIREWHNQKANLYLSMSHQNKCQIEAKKLMEQCNLHHEKYMHYLLLNHLKEA